MNTHQTNTREPDTAVPLMVQRLRTATLILEAAATAHLPMPFDVQINSHAVGEHIALLFRDAEDLEAWAEFTGEQAFLHAGRATIEAEMLGAVVLLAGRVADSPAVPLTVAAR